MIFPRDMDMAMDMADMDIVDMDMVDMDHLADLSRTFNRLDHIISVLAVLTSPPLVRHSIAHHLFGDAIVHCR